MRHRPRTMALVAAGALLLALLAASVALGANTSQGREPSMPGPQLKPVRGLGAVPDVVKVKSTKHPPRNVKFDGQPMPGGITTGTGTATGGPGEVVIPGVPGYIWRDGCGPTAVGMVVGYYDGHGWPDLIPGDATGETTDVDQAICSHGSASQPQSFEDYALPEETVAGQVLADKSAAPAGDEHASNCVADFMHTSWSAEGLPYGGSFSNKVGPGFSGYVKSKYPDSAPAVTTYSGSNLTWTLVKQEMTASRPMVFLVDSNGDGMTDHFVTAVGYRETNGYPEYACWDTWNSGLLRWQQFRAVSAAYQWGVWGAFAISIQAAQPSPTPTPTITPTPTPTPTPPAATDTTAPLTTALGLDTLWHNTSVTVTLSATDTQSGVAYTEYSLDGGAWTRGTSVAIAVPRKSSLATVHTLAYRSADVAGNVEATQLGTGEDRHHEARHDQQRHWRDPEGIVQPGAHSHRHGFRGCGHSLLC